MKWGTFKSKPVDAPLPPGVSSILHVPSHQMGKVKEDLTLRINHAFAMALVFEKLILQRGFFGRLKWLLTGR